MDKWLKIFGMLQNCLLLVVYTWNSTACRCRPVAYLDGFNPRSSSELDDYQ